MDEVSSFLKEWSINYIKNKDIIARKIETIENGKNGFDIVVRYKDRVNFFIIMPLITDIEKMIEKMDKDGHYGFIMLNNKENLDVVVKNWKKLADFKNLCLYFVNPFSQLDKKWLVYPYTHSSICDEDSLEAGLKAMFEMVEPITEEEIKKRLKQKSD